MPANNPNVDGLLWGVVSRFINYAGKLPDGYSSKMRQGAYGEMVNYQLTSKAHKVADEGSYYIVRSPTVGTGIATGAAVTALVDTTPFLIVSNNSSPSAGYAAKSIALDYIKFNYVVLGTGAASMLYHTKLDSQLRWSANGSGSGGTGLTAVLAGPYPVNAQSQSQSKALVYAGAMTAVASTGNARPLGNGTLRTAAPVVGDSYYFNFGPCQMAMDSSTIPGTAPAMRSIPHAPVVLGPQQTFALYLWSASQTVAANIEVEVGYIER